MADPLDETKTSDQTTFPDVESDVAFELDGNAVVVFNRAGGRTPIFVVSTWNEERRGLRHLAATLGSDQPMYAVTTPDFDDKYSYPRKIEEWTSRARAAYDAVTATGEVGLIVGWSFGGVVAAHLAQQLREDDVAGRPLELLMIDSRHPSTKQKAEPVRSPVHSMLHHSALAFEQPDGERARYLERRVRRIARRRLGRDVPQTVSESTTPSPLKRAIFVSWLKYESVVLEVDGTLLWCDDSMKDLGDISLGWGPWWRGRFESKYLGGGHYDVFLPGRVEAVAAEIERLLALGLSA